MLLLIDNYDSFTYNLVQRFAERAPSLRIEVVRNDAITPAQAAALKPSHLVISPGPCTPREAGVSADLIRQFKGAIPILGVCLGHQTIGDCHGMTVRRNDVPVHGKTSLVHHDSRGVYAGLTLSHTRAHLYRATLEATAFGVRHNLETMEAMGALPRRLVAVGGGAKNALWLQIVSDITGLPQDVPERTIGASYGDAFLAGLATGLVPDLDALKNEWVTLSLQLVPDAAVKPVYDAYYAVYRDLYQAARPQLHALARLGANRASTESVARP